MNVGRRLLILFTTLIVLLAIANNSNCVAKQVHSTKDLEFFEKEVRPLLVQHCYQCHSEGAKRVEAKLWLDSREAHLRGGDSGAAIVPRDADASLLIESVRYESYEMPPTGQLAERDIETLVRWVNMGAPWPKEAAPTAGNDSEGFDLEKRKSEFWVWQPITNPDPPSVKDETWPRNDIDRHILARLENAGLKPPVDADRTAMLRRIYFDLIGLPPTPQEVEAFIADEDPQAIERAVDRLLQSRHFGERWGRHWLDLVRYAESRGHEGDHDAVNAYQYRDYVIRALNADLPYDQFVREQIAGDLLSEPRLHPTQKFNESVLGTGFWFLGEWVHSPVDIRKDEADRFDNMIDVMSKTFLGSTVACARCHDHKFDAISTADYYSLSGFLQSSDYRQVRFESMEQNRTVANQLAAIDKRYQQKILKSLENEDVPLPKQTTHLDDENIVVDFGNISQSQYMQDGFIFGQAPRQAGNAYLEAEPNPTIRIAQFNAAVNDPIWGEFESISKGVVSNGSALAGIPRSGRTLRSPTFELKNGNVSCLVEGAGHVVACVDSHRLIRGPLHGETIRPIKAGQRWVTLNLSRYVGHRLHLEFVPAENSQLSIRLVTQGLDADGRADIDRRLAAGDKQFEEYARAAEATFKSNKQISKSWMHERSGLEKQIVRRSHLAIAMMDGSGEDDRVLIRGNSSKPGKIEPRHFLTAISGNSAMPINSGSGRLELAEQINDASNPLTSRVIVNRIWHHLMGRGIVPTVDDFGFLGQRPTHPELLDHLAKRFLADGRSIKRMIKYIVLSRTYQMSSHADNQAIEADPKNLLFHHRPPRRLQGEAIRDTLLAVSGRLDPTPYGPPVLIHLTSFMEGRGRPKESGPLDGKGRRSIYVAVRRNFLSPFMLAFDTPTPFSSMGRRNVSNVPAQALFLLNDPLVVEPSANWGERALKNVPNAGDEAVGRRVDWMYMSGFGRHPTPDESQAAVSFVNAQASKHDVTTEDPGIWSRLAHVLVNTKEFIFLR